MNIATLLQSLTKAHWSEANRALVKKIVTEFLYEEMLQTIIVHSSNDQSSHHLIVDSSLYYSFEANPRIFGNWHIDVDTITRWKDNKPSTELSVSQFIHDTYALIGIKGLTLGHLLRELNNTLVADCHILALNNLSTNELLSRNSYELEGHMHGHPWFVVNKGRLGFSYSDYLTDAPEMRHPIQLSWIAVSKKIASFHTSDKEYDQLISQELSEKDLKKFFHQLAEYSLSEKDYFFIPVHDWQWKNQLITLFSEDIVNQTVVYLGKSDDYYLPTLSIRTLNNVSDLTKHQVKLPLSIFNTAVYRGLPSDRTQAAPLLTSWLKKKYSEDSFFQKECRLIMLGEIASIDVPHFYYSQLDNIPYQYKELLGVIWRENVNVYLKPYESIVTMASLIHVDSFKKPFVSGLIEKSGLTTDVWLASFFKSTITPLLHWLYRYGVVFSPHGENTALILENGKPVGLVIKDFIDDVNISDTHLPETDDLPPSLRAILLKVDDKQLTQFIHTGLFVVLYRYLSDLLKTYDGYSEADFWQQVHDVIVDYHREHPSYHDRFLRFDLLRPSFNKMCLNRLRLLSVGYADYVDRPKVDTIEPMKNPANLDVINAFRKHDYFRYPTQVEG